MAMASDQRCTRFRHGLHRHVWVAGPCQCGAIEARIDSRLDPDVAVQPDDAARPAISEAAADVNAELLDALKALHRNVDRDLSGYWTESTSNVMQQAEAAIAKAERQDPETKTADRCERSAS